MSKPAYFYRTQHIFERNVLPLWYNEMPRKHIKAEYSNKNGWQFVTSKSDNPSQCPYYKGIKIIFQNFLKYFKVHY